MIQIKYNNDYFYSFKDGVHLNNDEIQNMIDEVVDNLITYNDDYHILSTGDTVVIGIKYSDEMQIIVSQDYDEATLFLENNEWVPVNYTVEYRRDELEELSRSELIDLVLRSEYNPRKEV